MVAQTMLSRIRTSLFYFEEVLSVTLGLRFPKPPPLSSVYVPGNDSVPVSNQDINDFGILWAVPRNRRTIEKRWKRKYGSEFYKLKIYTPKTNIMVCNTCGHYHEVGVFCGHCYARIAEETKAAQDAVQEKLGLSAVDKEVILLYDGEQAPSDQNKKIIEVKRPRPAWFSRNLMQRSTDVPSPTAVSAEPEVTPVSVKPSELG